MRRRTKSENAGNPLQIRVQALSVPARMTERQYLAALLNSVRTGEDLPRGVEVLLRWRNPNTKRGKTKRWRDDDFMDALADSTEGFRAVVHDSILKQIKRVRGRR